MATPFKASVITPEAIILETTITAAQVPVIDGLLGVLDHRAPLLSQLGTGILRLDTTDGGVQKFLVSGGYAQMKGEELNILASEAIPAKSITPQMISAEEAKLKSLTGDDKKSMDQRLVLQGRIAAMKAAKAA